MADSRCYDQGVLADLSVAENDRSGFGVEILYFRLEDGDVSVTAQDRAQRIGDVAGRQTACGYLIEQGLKKMEVAFVDERDVHR